MDQPGTPPTPDAGALRRLLDADRSALAGALPEVAALAKSAGPEEVLAHAAQLSFRGDLDSARGELTALIAAVGEPTAAAVRGRANNDLGNVETIAERYPAAIASYEKALQSGAPTVAVEHNLGVAYFKSGDGKQALRHLQLSGAEEDRKLARRLGLTQAEHRRPAAAPPGRAATPPTAQPGDDDSASGSRAAPKDLDARTTLIWLGRKP
jgi:hypothetical protein